MSNRRLSRRGFSLIELLIVIAIILIIITIAVPNFKGVLMSMRETAAVKAIQTINQMQIQYQNQFGRYATSLTELGPPTSGMAGPAAADLIQRDLAAGQKQGYKFTMTGTNGGYIVNANPVNFGSSGSKCFYSDQNMQIRENSGPEPATVTSPEWGAGK